jgi:ribose transport system substrate-binding protein
MRPRRFRPVSAALTVAAALIAALAAVGAGAGTARTAASPAQLIATLPGSLRALYVQTTDPIDPSAYGSFNAVKTPWKLCFADSYEGNDWRLDVRKELERLTAQFKAAGQVSGMTTAVSNGNVALQNSQIRSFVNQGCNVILSIPASATGINAAVQAAYKKGIPFISFAGAVTSPDAINVDSNYFLWGSDMATSIAKTIKSGNVVMVKGIEGQPVAVAENQGAASVWKKYPGINVIAQVNGNWTPSVTKSAMLQVISTHPQKISAVWTTGSESRFVAEVFSQSGKPVPLITASPTGDAIAYAKEHPGVHVVGGAVMPSWTADTAFRVAVRMLQGQHPRLNTLMVPIPPFDSNQLSKWYAPCMKDSSVTPFPVPPVDPLPEGMMNGYFTNGKATPPYNYTTIPSPCA